MLLLLAYKKKTKITDEYIFKRKDNSTIKGAVSRNLAKFSHFFPNLAKHNKTRLKPLTKGLNNTANTKEGTDGPN